MNLVLDNPVTLDDSPNLPVDIVFLLLLPETGDGRTA